MMATALRILVIEDERSVQQFLQAALERSGYTATVADSGVAGVERMKSGEEFDFIVSDMRTPGGMNGADVHRWVRANRPELASKMLFITGDIINEETSRVLQQTGVPWLEKPFRVHELLAAIERMMNAASPQPSVNAGSKP